MSTKPVAKILATQSSGLHTLLERAQYLQNLTQALRESLEPMLAEHVAIANLKEHTVVLTADSPAWLTQLRYQAPELLRILQQLPGLRSVSKVQLKIQAPSSAPVSKPPRHISLSANNAQLLESAAASTHDTALADALFRLSKHTRKDT